MNRRNINESSKLVTTFSHEVPYKDKFRN